MNIALLTAAGSGNRMGQDIPKQFMCIDNKPVIIYTMDSFQRCNEIDAICVVCLKGWEVVLQSYANQYGINKLKWIFEGGLTNQESIRNGLLGLKGAGCSDDDIILVHDGVRPLVSEEIISKNISTCKEYGYAVTGLMCREVIMEVNDNLLHSIDVPRERLVRTQTPHTYRLGSLINAHNEASEKGINATIASCVLMAELGIEEQHLVRGSELNGLKLTMPEDVEIFKALLCVTKESYIK